VTTQKPLPLPPGSTDLALTATASASYPSPWTTVSPVTTDGSQVYFADDGGGLRLPASWQVEYWNGTDWVAVPSPSGYPAADNTFNDVTYGSVTTTKLRAVMASGAGSVGMIQWIVDSVGS
jgi:hypothetical protein